MPDSEILKTLRKFEIPGLIAFGEGQGGLPRASVTTRSSSAEIYLHGAQMTRFQRHNEPPLLFLSRESRFGPGKAIRGGVPICFPWFGSRQGDVAHGFARITDWDLVGAAPNPDGGVTLSFRFPETPVRASWPAFSAEFIATIGETLTMELVVTNREKNRNFEFEECLHTYFAVADINGISLTGLGSTQYLDRTQNDARQIESEEPIQIRAQTDRTYLDTTSTVEIRDPLLRRTIRIEKSGSSSTVLWNPWTTQVLSDFGPDEYRQMVCVESGNVGRNRVILGSAQTARLKVRLSSF